MSLDIALKYELLTVGQQLESMIKLPVTKFQLVKYAGVSDDFNPLHTDDDFAKGIGMKGTIAYAMLSMCSLVGMLRQAGNNTKGSQFSIRFRAVTGS